jgi:hypothetical protein
MKLSNQILQTVYAKSEFARHRLGNSFDIVERIHEIDSNH